MAWTQFEDMHSGGDTKEEPFQYIYIESPLDEAVRIFYNRFGHNPYRVTCSCCGADYSTRESETLEQATAHNRGCARSNVFRQWGQRTDNKPWRPCMTLDDYRLKTDVLVIPAAEIMDSERHGDVPAQGYVWMD